MDYLLAAQYPNGGWPQFFPLRDGYYSRITYNDNAMVNVLTVLRDAAAGKPPYAFVDEARRVKARAAVSRGIDIILRTQLKQDGKLTAWCSQYDEKALAPAWARAYEPPSLSGSESVGIVRFLMEIEQPTPRDRRRHRRGRRVVQGGGDSRPAPRAVHRRRRAERQTRRPGSVSPSPVGPLLRARHQPSHIPRPRLRRSPCAQ